MIIWDNKSGKKEPDFLLITDVTHYLSKMFKKSFQKIGFLNGETMFKKF